ncbi:MAG: hypothetical protein ACYSWZ_16170 [Planctomycetota bacterium]|jgi:hypothetical protein
MDSFTILARAAEPAMRTTETVEEGFIPIDFIWKQILELHYVEALAFICFGVVCLLYGWRIFKILVTLCFALVGLFGGLMVNEKLVGGNGMWLGLMGVVMMTGGIWYAFALPDGYIWAGALAGLIAGGMISFIVFKLAVVLFTSFGGGALIVIAILAVLYEYFDPEKVRILVFDYRWFLPVAFIVPTLVGIIVQNKFISSSKDWNI